MKNHPKNCKCSPCCAKRGEMNGKNNPNYIDGRTNKKHYCIEEDCKNEISYDNWKYGNKRCKNCCQKGELSSRYIDGRKNKKGKCSICERTINLYCNNSGLCSFCRNKGENNGNFQWGDILTKEFLIREYIKNKKSTYKMAKEIGCSGVTIQNYLKLYNIKVRKPKRITLKKYRCEICGKRISFQNTLYGGGGKCLICTGLELWKSPIYRNKMLKAQMKGLQLTPNIPEKKLNNLLNILFPHEYKFVGDGKVILGGFNPDFINCNGQKKIIELYGDYWHNLSNYKERDKRRLREYSRLGYSTLIVWGKELKDRNRLKEKLIRFNGDKLCKQK